MAITRTISVDYMKKCLRVEHNLRGTWDEEVKKFIDRHGTVQSSSELGNDVDECTTDDASSATEDLDKVSHRVKVKKNTTIDADQGSDHSSSTTPDESESESSYVPDDVNGESITSVDTRSCASSPAGQHVAIQSFPRSHPRSPRVAMARFDNKPRQEANSPKRNIVRPRYNVWRDFGPPRDFLSIDNPVVPGSLVLGVAGTGGSHPPYSTASSLHGHVRKENAQMQLLDICKRLETIGARSKALRQSEQEQQELLEQFPDLRQMFRSQASRIEEEQRACYNQFLELKQKFRAREQLFASTTSKFEKFGDSTFFEQWKQMRTTPRQFWQSRLQSTDPNEKRAAQRLLQDFPSSA